MLSAGLPETYAPFRRRSTVCFRTMSAYFVIMSLIVIGRLLALPVLMAVTAFVTNQMSLRGG